MVEPRNVSRRNRRAWWARFTFNGITRYDQGAYDLVGGEELSDAEHDQLLQLCRQRLDAFREQRGEEVFAHSSRHRTPISGSIKYQVLTRAKGRCECCGAHEHQRALEVDHIVPRNQGGSDDLSNLQALCFRCNAAKRWEVGCVFCALEASGRVLLENELALCIADGYPVTPGHSLVIPRRHVADGLALHQPEWNGVVDAGRRSRNQIRWAGTVRWSAARRPEPAWPASDHGWPASSARSLR